MEMKENGEERGVGNEEKRGDDEVTVCVIRYHRIIIFI